MEQPSRQDGRDIIPREYGDLPEGVTYRDDTPIPRETEEAPTPEDWEEYEKILSEEERGAFYDWYYDTWPEEWPLEGGDYESRSHGS